ncbi:DNAse I-like superfamily protein [Striga asiatica]|uniref:DNAse I-like superfamily protein n=1 Tax=Striga asiatica TaxID=4170 RepID=A0A5A7QRX2_STRAF|nr:DNAse I-like superfamily protein [Striga asiatica]
MPLSSSSKPPSLSKLPTGYAKLESNPKPGLTTVPPNSASYSSAAPPPPPEKRTRDQPNYSNCHCCGHRINSTNPRDRLQPLNSVWRIVLLCRKCRRNVHSGQTCPYCFRGTGNSGGGLERFSVCIDCWVPELLKNSVMICRRSENSGRSKENGKEHEAEKKVPPSRAKVGKKNVEDSESLETNNLSCGGTLEVVDDAKLAIQLHRAINSSPRNLRGGDLAKNSSDLDVSCIMNWSGVSYKRSHLGKNNIEDQKIGRCANIAQNERMTWLGNIDYRFDSAEVSQGLKCYKRDKTRKIWKLTEDNAMAYEAISSPHDIGILEASISGDADRNRVDRYGKELLSYRRCGSKRKLFQESGIGVSGESNSQDNHEANFKPDFSQMDDGGFRLGCQIKSDDTEVILPNECCIVDRDRFLLKYGKRGRGTKSESCFQHFSNLLSQNQTSQSNLNKLEAVLTKDCAHGSIIIEESYRNLPQAFCTMTLLSENQSSLRDLDDNSAVKVDGTLSLQLGNVNQDSDR